MPFFDLGAGRGQAAARAAYAAACGRELDAVSTVHDAHWVALRLAGALRANGVSAVADDDPRTPAEPFLPRYYGVVDPDGWAEVARVYDFPHEVTTGGDPGGPRVASSDLFLYLCMAEAFLETDPSAQNALLACAHLCDDPPCDGGDAAAVAARTAADPRTSPWEH
jgi:hypothetical protein